VRACNLVARLLALSFARPSFFAGAALIIPKVIAKNKGKKYTQQQNGQHDIISGIWVKKMRLIYVNRILKFFKKYDKIY